MSRTQIKVPTREEIEIRAYEIYLGRGGEGGNAVEDWLAAEKELSESSRTNVSDPTVPLAKRSAAS